MTERPIGAPLPTEADGKWMLPRDMPSFLRLLAASPSMGDTDQERVRKFRTFEHAKAMPDSLREALEKRGLK